MLIVNLKTGQAVALTLPDGREVRVELLERRKVNRAYLGITADRDIPVLRGDAKTKEPKVERS